MRTCKVKKSNFVMHDYDGKMPLLDIERGKEIKIRESIYEAKAQQEIGGNSLA